MLKLTVTLSAALYALLVIFADDKGPGGGTPDNIRVPNATPALSGQTVTADPTAQMATYDGRVLTVAARIDPTEGVADRASVPLITTRVPVADAAAGPGVAEVVSVSASTATTPEIVAVTGSTVNLRAGPSTNDAIIGSLSRGTEAEVTGVAGDDWSRIRVRDTGVEGFMATRFLAPAN